MHAARFDPIMWPSGMWTNYRHHSVWIKPTDALNFNCIGITTLRVSGSLSAHHQEFIDVHRLWYILCSCDDRVLPGVGWNCLQFHPTPGSTRSSQLHKMYQSRCTSKNSWWWAERLPETRRVVIPIKLEFSASVGFIHTDSVTMHGHTIVKYRHHFALMLFINVVILTLLINRFKQGIIINLVSFSKIRINFKTLATSGVHMQEWIYYLVILIPHARTHAQTHSALCSLSWSQNPSTWFLRTDLNPAHIAAPHFLKNHFDIIVPFIPRSPSWPLQLKFFDPTFLPHLSFAMHDTASIISHCELP